MKDHPSYVMHDGERWHVDGDDVDEDGLWYFLSRHTPKGKARLDAKAIECEPWKPKGPRVRKLKDRDYSLEFDGRTMTIRKARSRMRWPVSLAGIYSTAVKAAVAAAKFKRQQEKRAKRRK